LARRLSSASQDFGIVVTVSPHSESSKQAPLSQRAAGLDQVQSERNVVR
jgi:hypothetical protein